MLNPGSPPPPPNGIHTISCVFHLFLQFLGDSDNPYTFGTEKSSVGKGVMSLGYSCGGEKVAVADASEPVEMWMEREWAVGWG